ncbi:hypothetical protein A2U01_0054373, partial [Trifolium medium]|nr:hypothetical protein [Trifolium medium]
VDATGVSSVAPTSGAYKLELRLGVEVRYPDVSSKSGFVMKQMMDSED